MTVRPGRIIVVAALAAGAALALAVAAPAAHADLSLTARLHNAQRALRDADARLDAAQAALDAALAGEATPSGGSGDDPQVTTAPPADVQALQAEVDKAAADVAFWQKRVRRLTARVRQEKQIAAWESRGDWMPIINVAAGRYHVKAAGMYRMMLRESGGQARAGAGTPFRGLYQYWTGTWAADWNPWRHDCIFDGSSQIFATAYAISKGLGPQFWTTTFASQY